MDLERIKRFCKIYYGQNTVPLILIAVITVWQFLSIGLYFINCHNNQLTKIEQFFALESVSFLLVFGIVIILAICYFVISGIYNFIKKSKTIAIINNIKVTRPTLFR